MASPDNQICQAQEPSSSWGELDAKIEKTLPSLCILL